MHKPDEPDIQRRDLLTGRPARGRDAGPAMLHLSSAIVTTRPEHLAEVARTLSRMGAEVRAAQGSKIVIVLEGRSVGEIGGRMTEISVMDRVISASMVFEQILPLEESEAQA